MIKNIIFDIGNVLVRFQPDEAMREIGIEENKIAALAHATYENPVWVELDRGVIPENSMRRISGDFLKRERLLL